MADDKTYTQAELDAEVAGLKTKNTELITAQKELRAALEPWKGLDPKKVSEVLSAHDKMIADKQKGEGDWESREKKLREDYAKEHATVVEPLKAEVAQLTGDLFEAIAVRDAVQAMADPEVKANPRLILPVIQPELGVALVDGKRVTVVKGQDGKPRYHQTSGALVSVKDRLKELRAVKEYGGGFEGVGGGGSGGRGSDAPGGANDAEVRKLPGTRMVEAAFAGGQTKAK